MAVLLAEDDVLLSLPHAGSQCFLGRWRLGPGPRLLTVRDVALGGQEVESPPAVWALLGLRHPRLLLTPGAWRIGRRFGRQVVE